MCVKTVFDTAEYAILYLNIRYVCPNTGHDYDLCMTPVMNSGVEFENISKWGLLIVYQITDGNKESVEP